MTKQLFPLISADVAIFSIGDDCLQVLLVKRAQEPAKGVWALPGAVLKPERDADLEATARRALRDKLSVEVPYLKQLRAFAGATRDPRGWSIGVLHYALLPRDKVHAVIQSKVEAVSWVDVDAKLPKLAFDHNEQLRTARFALRERVQDHRLPLHLMREQFTLTQLQRVCELILASGNRNDPALDKGAFRRRFARSANIIEIPGAFERGAQRPAQLFKVSAEFEF